MLTNTIEFEVGVAIVRKRRGGSRRCKHALELFLQLRRVVLRQLHFHLRTSINRYTSFLLFSTSLNNVDSRKIRSAQLILLGKG
jgi:hypothetical protein